MTNQWVVAGIICILGACRRGDGVPAAATALDSARSDSARTVSPSPPQAPLGGGTTGTARNGGVLVALDGDGLQFVSAQTGSTRRIAFGAGEEQVLIALAAALGPPASRGTNADCGAGPVEFVAYDDGLSIVIRTARFVGWSARRSASGARLTTISGVGVGTTRTALDSSYVTRISQTTLGTEFAAGGIFGLIEGSLPQARITDLWAGTSCVAR